VFVIPGLPLFVFVIPGLPLFVFVIPGLPQAEPGISGYRHPRASRRPMRFRIALSRVRNDAEECFGIPGVATL